MKVKVAMIRLENGVEANYWVDTYFGDDVSLEELIKNYFVNEAPAEPYLDLQHIFGNVVFNHQYVTLSTGEVMYLHSHKYIFTEIK